MNIEYHGHLIQDCSIQGERKQDGVVPAHCAPALKLSPDRWIIFYATLDSRGHDASKSIIYQIRTAHPAGKIIKEACIVPNDEQWDALGNGSCFWKCNGMPIAFGMPKSKNKRANENVFFLKWYRYAHLLKDNVLHNSGSGKWPGAPEVLQKTLRIESLQFKLNDQEDDIEIISPARLMTQKDYPDVNEFCELGDHFSMNHSMAPPVPINADCTEWVEYDTFTPCNTGIGGHGSVAPIKYSFNTATGLYEWTKTGPLLSIPNEIIGESSLCFDGTDFIVSLRSFSSFNTILLKTSDPFCNKFTYSAHETGGTPRIMWQCSNGKLRLFTNSPQLSPYNEKRNPLCSFDVNTSDLSLSGPSIVFDARQAGLPFKTPFVDMAKLFPECNGTQILAFRLITRSQTVGNCPDSPKPTSTEIAASGIHYVTLK
jgi:hypothetical protein